jgi:hypothetical protein
MKTVDITQYTVDITQYTGYPAVLLSLSMNGISANVTSNEQDLYFNTIRQILRKSGTVYMLQAKMCVFCI